MENQGKTTKQILDNTKILIIALILAGITLLIISW